MSWQPASLCVGMALTFALYTVHGYRAGTVGWYYDGICTCLCVLVALAVRKRGATR